MAENMQKENSKATKLLQQLLFLLGVVVLWQLLYFVGVDVLDIWKPYAMPSPAGVWKSLLRLVESGTLFAAIGNSLLRGMIGFLISVTAGVLLGFLMERFPFLHQNMRPFVMGIQTLPSVCWVPFSILWFGLSEQAIIFVVVMGSAFSIAIATDNAIHHVPPLYKKAALTMGATQQQIYRKVILHACLPELVSGLKQGWSFAWRALMSGEVMTTCIGLGQTLITGRNLADINQVMLVMIIIVLVGILIDQIFFRSLERRIYKKRGLA